MGQTKQSIRLKPLLFLNIMVYVDMCYNVKLGVGGGRVGVVLGFIELRELDFITSERKVITHIE